VNENNCLQRFLAGRTGFRFLLFLFCLAAMAVLPGLSGQAAAQQTDPPSRVARLNLIQGSLSFQPAGQQDWVEANHNRPLTTGDNLWADQDSQGELHIGSTAIRISSQTSISFLNLDDQVAQIQLAQGSMDIRVRRMDQNEAYEVDMPNVAFSILSPGEYRFDVDPSGQSSTITVKVGNGDATGGNNTYNLIAGQQANFNGAPDQVQYSLQGAPAPDDFDQFCSSRDAREDRSASARWVSRDVTGYDDLDEYGSWRPDPTYGQVWVPSGVVAGWAPYHAGHWAYVVPWGWTWVDDAPWGFAPFHYGRWAYVNGYWGWVPGPIAVQPVYAPALVGFVGGGFGLTLSIGGGQGVAWFALGPRDVFVPAYPVSPMYVQNINVSNTTVINRTEVVNVYNNYQVTHVTNVTYVNQSAPGAVMAVSRDTFVNARPVAAASIKISPQEIQHPQVIKTAAPLAPTAAARIGPNAPAKASARPPAALASHPVVTKRAPSPRAAPVGKPALVKAGPVHPAAPTPPRGQPAPRPAQPAAVRPATPAPAKPAPPVAKPAVPPPPPAAHPQPARPAAPPPAAPKPAPKPEAKPAVPPAEKPVPHPPAAAPKPAPTAEKAATPPPKKEPPKKEPPDEKPKPE
jgi:hypothetical protein